MISIHEALLLFAIGLLYGCIAIAVDAVRPSTSRRPALEFPSRHAADADTEEVACRV